MILDAAVTVKAIRHTITMLKIKNPNYESEPAWLILMALEELAKTFETMQDNVLDIDEIVRQKKKTDDDSGWGA